MQKIALGSGQISLCGWHECRQGDCPLANMTSVELCLRGLKRNSLSMIALRQIAAAQRPGLDLSRTTDDDAIESIVHAIGCRRLRVCRKTGAGDRASSLARSGSYGQSPEERVIQGLRSKDQPFAFEGQKLRIIRANQWPALRGDQRYQIIERENARQILA